MKRLIAIVLAWLPLLAWGYDFSAVAPGGQTLYYKYCEGGVTLTYPSGLYTPSQGWDGYVRPVGELQVPDSVSYQGTRYAVVSVGYGAFYGCEALTSVTLPEGVTSIDNSALEGCSALVSVVLPSTLQSIGSRSFCNCTSLAHIYAHGQQPPVTHTNAFFGTALGGVTLHVPGCGLEAWGDEAVWGQMAVEAFYPCAATLTTATNDTARGAVTGGGSYAYGTFVTLTAQAAEGSFFAGWSDGDTANPRIVHLTADTLFRALFFAVRIDRVVVCDTLWVRDTVYPTFFRLRVESDDTSRGLGVGSGLLPAGTEAEVCGLPLEGFRFLGWSDGEAGNPRRVTLTADTVLRALFSPAAIGEVSLPHWTATLEELRLTVRCAAGERLRLYDPLGRLCRETVATDEATTLELPSTGVWLLRVGDGAARKIVAQGR